MAPATDDADRDAPTMTNHDDELIRAIEPDLARLQRFARLVGGDSADDLVADALARTLPVWRRTQIADPAAYLRRTIANLARRRWRRGALARDRDHAALAWSLPLPDHPERHADRDRAIRALATLPPRRRAVIVLRYYEDLPLDRIADVLGIRVGTVKSQLSRGLEQLRTILEDQDTT